MEPNIMNSTNLPWAWGLAYAEYGLRVRTYRVVKFIVNVRDMLKSVKRKVGRV